jgi:flavorubredoxin
VGAPRAHGDGLSPPPEIARRRPLRIAADTFVIQGFVAADQGPAGIPVNAMVIRGREPVVVDTGAPIHRAAYLDDLFGIVEPEDVRWVFVSHEDADHIGNLAALMESCPNATMVGSWFLWKRTAVEPLEVPSRRWRWVNAGESLHVGDRELHAFRPPAYDGPTTRGLFDPRTGVCWAADCFATIVPHVCDDVGEMPVETWEEGFTVFQLWNSPWLALVDPAKFARACDALAHHEIRAIASAHSPVVQGADVTRAFGLLRGLAGREVPPQPGQPVLDQILAAAARAADGVAAAGSV